jgi:hypothetical protein
MPTKSSSDIELIDSAGGVRSEPVGRAEQPAGGAPLAGVDLPPEVRDRLSDEVIDQLLVGAPQPPCAAAAFAFTYSSAVIGS